ncbi:MAG: SsrA-binding protein [Candidatus Doudnabacteria bacterium RIFCSPHIGHO2_02_FULL_46_11]|uniref:SsrA-binding protein n=1 Tax=Candidatus Doudnabacteria bacterium RIFCSPHIGHO2_02_FULL_46_11 TaxID=1817832 RepID=A0A1F5P4Q7_9BACT|nr:MAG: SsrA-binding protein [Candidatus Doudnabacteria bacterium RIFCSPHIGHO2_02_FULL_46_11]
MPTLAQNRQALHDFTILDTLEAGIVLSGQEVKSARLGQMSLKGSFVNFKNNEALLVNAYISRYQKAGPDPSYKPDRDRKLLLNARELQNIADRKHTEGLAVVPLSVYTKGKLVKVKIGLARGKRKFDKRESIKKREQQRKIRRIVNR